MLILGVDPGLNTGYCFLNDGIIGEFGIVKGKEEIYTWLGSLPKIDVMIVEDYIVRPAKSGGFDHSWNKGFTLRIIGALELYAFAKGIPFILQQPSIKAVASGMEFGKPYKKQTNRHWHDAHLHAAYWWRTGPGKPGRNVRSS